MQLIYSKSKLHFWLVKQGVVLVQGGHIQIANYIKENDLMDVSEFKYAVEQMDQNGHCMSQFGVLGGFLYTEAA